MAKLDDYQFVLDGTYLSDLFFNHEHPNYSALYEDKDKGFSDDDLRTAVLKDAEGFTDCLPTSDIPDRPAFHAALADDFLRRL